MFYVVEFKKNIIDSFNIQKHINSSCGIVINGDSIRYLAEFNKLITVLFKTITNGRVFLHLE